MKLYSGIHLDSFGSPKAGTQIQVLQTGTNTLVPIFDSAGNSTANPLTTDANGRFAFRVASGTYDFKDSNNTFALTAVQIFDLGIPSEWLNAGKIPVSSPLTGPTIQDEIARLLLLIVSPSTLISESPPAPLGGGTAGIDYQLAFLPASDQLFIFRNGIFQAKRASGSPTVGQFTLTGQNLKLGGDPLGASESLVARYWRPGT